MMHRRALMSGLAALPLSMPARAQTGLPLVAILSPSSPQAAVIKLVNQPFKQTMATLGHVPGRTVTYAERYAEGDESRLPALAAELVALQPRVIFTNASAAATAMARATSTIPIVVGPAGEAVLIALAGGNMARPTTNVTGLVLTSSEIDTKCVALLLEAAPSIRRVGILVNPNNPGQQDYPAALNAAVKALAAVLIRLDAKGAFDLEAALVRIKAERLDALFVADDLHIAADPGVREKVLRFAMTNSMPVASSHLNFARDGALLAMGPSIPALAARAAVYVDKILKGTTPAYLPVERPSVFTTIVNLRTAGALGVSLPTSILLRADEVIE